MPLSSMTGFGQAEVSSPSGTYHVEIRSVNNRFLEIQTRMPRSFSNLEQKIKKLLSNKIARGSVAVNIFWNHEGTLRSWYITEYARAYFNHDFSVDLSYNNEFKLYEKKYYMKNFH